MVLLKPSFTNWVWSCTTLLVWESGGVCLTTSSCWASSVGRVCKMYRLLHSFFFRMVFVKHMFVSCFVLFRSDLNKVICPCKINYLALRVSLTNRFFNVQCSRQMPLTLFKLVTLLLLNRHLFSAKSGFVAHFLQKVLVLLQKSSVTALLFSINFLLTHVFFIWL